jgi:hypothetical protein
VCSGISERRSSIEMTAADRKSTEITIHPLDPEDAAMTAAMRAVLSATKGVSRGIEARGQFDTVMERVLPLDDVASKRAFSAAYQEFGCILSSAAGAGDPPSMPTACYFAWGCFRYFGSARLRGSLPKLFHRHRCQMHDRAVSGCCCSCLKLRVVDLIMPRESEYAISIFVNNCWLGIKQQIPRVERIQIWKVIPRIDHNSRHSHRDTAPHTTRGAAASLRLGARWTPHRVERRSFG